MALVQGSLGPMGLRSRSLAPRDHALMPLKHEIVMKIFTIIVLIIQATASIYWATDVKSWKDYLSLIISIFLLGLYSWGLWHLATMP